MEVVGRLARPNGVTGHVNSSSGRRVRSCAADEAYSASSAIRSRRRDLRRFLTGCFEERRVDAVNDADAGRLQEFGGRSVRTSRHRQRRRPHHHCASQGCSGAIDENRIETRDACGRGQRASACPGGWEGDLFDGEGFVRGMEAEGRDLRGARCALVGCGGAGAAISFAFSKPASNLLRFGTSIRASRKLWRAAAGRLRDRMFPLPYRMLRPTSPSTPRRLE